MPEQIRLWDMLMEILDQMALVLKEQHLSPRRWSELFQLVVQSEEIAFIPQGVDEVSVGGADRSRPAAPRAVFLIGAEEGEFPRTPVSAGVFSDAERRLMISMGLPLYDSLEKLAVEERYLAYMAAVSPSEAISSLYPAPTCPAGRDRHPPWCGRFGRFSPNVRWRIAPRRLSLICSGRRSPLLSLPPVCGGSLRKERKP